MDDRNTYGSSLTDDQLVNIAVSGNQMAINALISRYKYIVIAIARSYFFNNSDMEDLIQEGMIGLYKAIADYRQREDGCSFKNFAYLCVSRRIIDAVKGALRKKSVPAIYFGVFEDGEMPSSELNPEEMMIMRDDRREFRQKISGVLSDFEFKVITMYIDGMTCAEICTATGKTAKSVDNAIQRSKKKLQIVFKK